MTHPADRLAFDRTVAARPVWNRIELARNAVGLEDNVLLHAGPPFQAVDEISRPLMISAGVAAVYEGLAGNLDQAEAMIRSGEIRLAPAQDRGVVVPFISVVSATMPLLAIYDAWRGRIRAFAPISTGASPNADLGFEGMLDQIRWLHGPVCAALEAGLAEGIELVPLLAEALREPYPSQDWTASGAGILIGEIEERTSGGLRDSEIVSCLKSSPDLFRNLGMAAVKCLLGVAEGVDDAALVTVAGCNGTSFGIQISSNPGKWFSVSADMPGGDEAILSAYGLGRRAAIVDRPRWTPPGIGFHPDFRDPRCRLGVSAREVAAGGGDEMPPAVFRAAMAAIGEPLQN